MEAMASPCRCGHTGEGPHPCHGKAYTCRRPASWRGDVTPAALSGSSPKVAVRATWACDDCWAAFCSGADGSGPR